MTDKKRSPAGRQPKRSKEITHLQYTPEFSEKQAEKIFNRDFSQLVCGAVTVLIIVLVLGWCEAI